MMKKPTVKKDPVLEAIACKLSGIESAPPETQRRMIKAAAKAGHKETHGLVYELCVALDAATAWRTMDLPMVSDSPFMAKVDELFERAGYGGRK